MAELGQAMCSLEAHRKKQENKAGKVATSELINEIKENGAFVRQKNRFDTPFGDGEGQLPVEKGRYRLIWTPLCPWATRQKIALN